MNRRQFITSLAGTSLTPLELPRPNLEVMSDISKIQGQLAVIFGIPKDLMLNSPSMTTSSYVRQLEGFSRQFHNYLLREFRFTPRVQGQPTDSFQSQLCEGVSTPMFEPSIFDNDRSDELKLAYDGNPESVGQKIYFHPDSGSLVYSFDVNGKLVLADTGMTFENVIQDFTIAGQGMSPLKTMWQFATQETAEQVVRIILNEVKLPVEVKTEIKEDAANVAFPTTKPMRSIYVTNKENDKTIRLNAGLEAFSFASTLIVSPRVGGGAPPNTYDVKYVPHDKVAMLHNSIVDQILS